MQETIEAAPETEFSQNNKLLRILGLGFGLAVVVGGIIGVSIFRLPGPIAALLGKTWLILASENQPAILSFKDCFGTVTAEGIPARR